MTVVAIGAVLIIIIIIITIIIIIIIIIINKTNLKRTHTLGFW